MQYSTFDYTHYPFVFVTTNPIDPTPEQHEEFFRDFERMFSMDQQAIVIFNSKNQKLINSAARIQAGKWVKEVEGKLKDKVRCVFFTEASIWLSIVLKAIYLVGKPPTPIHSVSTLQDARVQLKKLYGIDMSPSITPRV